MPCPVEATVVDSCSFENSETEVCRVLGVCLPWWSRRAKHNTKHQETLVQGFATLFAELALAASSGLTSADNRHAEGARRFAEP